MKIIHKIFTFIFLLTTLSWTSFAQLKDTTIIAKSKTIELKYSPKTPVTKTKIIFLKFKETYGIQFLFLTPDKYIPHIFIESIDSLILDLADDKKIILNKLCSDINYKELPDTYTFQLSYFIDKIKFDELRKKKIIKITTSHGGNPLTLRIKRKSQKEILNIADLF